MLYMLGMELDPLSKDWDNPDFEKFLDTTLAESLAQLPSRSEPGELGGWPRIKSEAAASRNQLRTGSFAAESGTASMEKWSGGSGDSGPSSPRKQKNKAVSSSAKRTAELQEKNRRAQRRFRERQKAKVSELEGKVSELTSQISSLMSDKAALDSRIGILNRVLRMREEHIEMLQRSKGSGNEPVESAEQMEDLRLTSQQGQPITFTAEQLKILTRQQAVGIWKGYVNQMAVLLVEADSGASQSTMATLQRLVQELCALVMKMYMLNPLTTREFTAQKLEESGNEVPGAPESSERWLTLARALGLTQQQRYELVQLRRLFLSKMNTIVQQRQEIHQSLVYAMPMPSFSRATAIQSLRTHEGIEQLRANLKEEHLLKMDWVMTLLKHTLTPVQVARALVQSWPWAPDTLAMATWIAAEENEPDAMAMLAQASRPLLPDPPPLGNGDCHSAPLAGLTSSMGMPPMPSAGPGPALDTMGSLPGFPQVGAPLGGLPASAGFAPLGSVGWSSAPGIGGGVGGGEVDGAPSGGLPNGGGPPFGSGGFQSLPPMMQRQPFDLDILDGTGGLPGLSTSQPQF